MTDFIKEEKSKMAMLVDEKDYHVSMRGYPIVSFEEIKFEEGDLFLGKQIRNYNPIWFCDSFQFVCNYLFSKHENLQSITTPKIVDNGIEQELANRGIFEDFNHNYVVCKQIEKERIR